MTDGRTRASRHSRAQLHIVHRHLRSRLRRADLLQGLAWFSAVVAVALFIADGGASYFVRLRDVPTGLGIIAGLVGSDLVLVMLLLAARLPIIDQNVGYDRAMATHRRLAKPALYLLLAHFVLLLAGYGLALGLDPIALTLRFLASGPDLAFAYASLALLVIVVISSLVVIRHRLTYQFWFVIHLLTYAAVILGIPHQFSEGSLFAPGKASRWYWAALYVATLAGITIFRIIVPVARSLRHRLRVAAVQSEAPGVASLIIEGRNLDRLKVQAGQFFIWRFGQPGLRWEGHPYSLSAVPDGKRLRITVRDLGDSSRQLVEAQPGIRAFIEGPYGMFSTRARTQPNTVLIGAGIGVTSICALLGEMADTADRVTVILRAEAEDQLYLRPDFIRLSARDTVTLHILIGLPPAEQPSWLSAAAIEQGMSLEKLAPDLATSDVFFCGPPHWSDLVEEAARLAQVSPRQLHAERFNW